MNERSGGKEGKGRQCGFIFFIKVPFPNSFFLTDAASS